MHLVVKNEMLYCSIFIKKEVIMKKSTVFRALSLVFCAVLSSFSQQADAKTMAIMVKLPSFIAREIGGAESYFRRGIDRKLFDVKAKGKTRIRDCDALFNIFERFVRIYEIFP